MNNGCAVRLFLSVSPEEAVGKEDRTGIIQFYQPEQARVKIIWTAYLQRVILCKCHARVSLPWWTPIVRPPAPHPLGVVSCSGLPASFHPEWGLGIHHIQTTHYQAVESGVTRLYQASTLLLYPLQLPSTQRGKVDSLSQQRRLPWPPLVPGRLSPARFQYSPPPLCN